jgi:hypothetical protein
MQTCVRLGQGAGQACMIRVMVLSGVGLSRSTWATAAAATAMATVSSGSEGGDDGEAHARDSRHGGGRETH